MPEDDLAGIFIHALYDCQRFHPDAVLSQSGSSGHLSLFNGDSHALHDSAGAADQVNQPPHGTAVGKKVIDDQHVFTRLDVLF